MQALQAWWARQQPGQRGPRGRPRGQPGLDSHGNPASSAPISAPVSRLGADEGLSAVGWRAVWSQADGRRS